MPPVPGARPKSAPTQSIRNLKPDPIVTQTVAKLEPESIPLPPVKRPGLQPPTGEIRQAAHRPTSKRTHTPKTAGAPINLLSFLKNLVAPEKKRRARKHRSHAQLRSGR
jgi:hypothetical protein